MDSRDADNVMLRRSDEVSDDPLYGFIGKELTTDELEAFGKSRRLKKKGMTISPMFTVKYLGRKNKKPVLVPFVGIQGTF